MERAYEKLLRYAAIDTQSDPASNTCPSTEGQWQLARLLVDELQAIGLEDISLDENGYVFATLPANTEQAIPTIGFLAHMDTSPDYPGACTNPQRLIYKGGPIVLNETLQIDPQEFPDLNELIGEELLTTRGDTLLGADDKAGIAEIMTAMEYLLAHPEIKHGKLRIGFTPDEEIGRGPHRFDVEAFGADFAYTVDGGRLGELQYESFNAASATVRICGKSIHPGSAKNKLINATLIGMELQAMLPVFARPEHTEGYEGFFLLTHFQGSVEKAELEYIIRDFDRDAFTEKKEFLEKAVSFLNEKYGNRLTLVLEDTYYNMREIIDQTPELIDRARGVMESLGITPLLVPVRGGTDGSQLSYMGLPAPNLFTGGMNYHGPYELIPTRWMDQAVEVLVHLAASFAKEA